MTAMLASAYGNNDSRRGRHRPSSPLESPLLVKGPRTPPSPKGGPQSPPPISLSPRSKRRRSPPSVSDLDNPSKRRRSRDRDVSRDHRRPDRHDEKRPRTPPR